jgi:hypothetical protein
MKKKNVTFVITENFDREIETRAFLEQKQKSEILIEALNLYFSENKRLPLPNEKPSPYVSKSKKAANA